MKFGCAAEMCRSPESARSDYGVVLDGDRVDTAATERLRARMCQIPSPPAGEGQGGGAA